LITHWRRSDIDTFPDECPVELHNSSNSLIFHCSIVVLGTDAISRPGNSQMKEPGIRVSPVRLVDTLPTEAMIDVHEIPIDSVKSSRVASVSKLLGRVMNIDVIHSILKHIVHLVCQSVQISTQLLYQFWA